MTSTQVDTARVVVVFDGEALQIHQMNVRDLAPALLGLADVFQRANELAFPGQPPVSLNIQAAAEGSFLVDLAVVHEAVVNWLTGPDSDALQALIGLVGSGAGVFAWLRSLHRRRGQPEALPNGYVRVTLDDGTTIDFPPVVPVIAASSEVRTAIEPVLAPLERDGVDWFEFRRTPEASSALVRISDQDLQPIYSALADSQRGEPLLDTTFPQVLSVTSPTFQPGNKWRLNDGQTTFWAAMEDGVFLNRIDRGEIAFAKGDRIDATIRLQQWDDGHGNLHSERTVLSVNQFLRAARPQQGELY